MDLDESYTPFPGARVTSTEIHGHHHPAPPVQPSQNAAWQNSRPAERLALHQMSHRPSRPTPAPLSVLLKASPIKADEYAEHDVDLTVDEAPARKRGRPKGWKVGMSYAEMRGDAAPRPVAARVGRPPGRQKQMPNYSLKRRRKTTARLDSPPPRELYLALKPTFTRFLCEWSDCKADLHNMDTLRRHVATVHLKTQRQQGCLWSTCAKKPSSTGPSDGKTLAEHLEQAHLVPMSWHVGDGPKNSWDWSTRNDGEGDDIPDFLKDRNGNQVTPSTRGQEIEDLLTYKNNRRKLKELIMRRDENLESQSSGESSGGEMDPRP